MAKAQHAVIAIGVALALMASGCGSAADPIGEVIAAPVDEASLGDVGQTIGCAGSAFPKEGTASGRADAVFDGVYSVGAPHGAVQLTADLDWSEDPIEDANWRFQFHSLRWGRDLVLAAEKSGDQKYLDLLERHLQDWIATNPWGSEVSDYAWNDHTAAWRTLMFSCFRDVLDAPVWLDVALVQHARALASDSFYVEVGNHALNQDRGLFAAGCVLGRQDFMDLAIARMSQLIDDSIDDAGVTDEQAPGYQSYNRGIYRQAVGEIEACGQTLAGVGDTVIAMEDFLVWSTKPNGRYAMIGDTRDVAGIAPPSPDMELSRRFDAGFLFGRQSWSDPNSAWFSARFGPVRTLHGHDDHGSITWFKDGEDLLIDPGLFAYNAPPFRGWFIRREAHNLVHVAGATVDRVSGATLDSYQSNAAGDQFAISYEGYEGVSVVREGRFDRLTGNITVKDELTSEDTETFQQLWHLAETAEVLEFTTSGALVQVGDVTVRITQDVPSDQVELLIGEEDPIQGWVSYAHQQRSPAPVLVFEISGKSVNFSTHLTTE